MIHLSLNMEAAKTDIVTLFKNSIHPQLLVIAATQRWANELATEFAFAISGSALALGPGAARVQVGNRYPDDLGLTRIVNFASAENPDKLRGFRASDILVCIDRVSWSVIDTVIRGMLGPVKQEKGITEIENDATLKEIKVLDTLKQELLAEINRTGDEIWSDKRELAPLLNLPPTDELSHEGKRKFERLQTRIATMRVKWSNDVASYLKIVELSRVLRADSE